MGLPVNFYILFTSDGLEAIVHRGQRCQKHIGINIQKLGYGVFCAD